MDSTEKTVTIYITSYALTRGILRRDGIELTSGRGFHYRDTPKSYPTYVFGKDVWLTEADAVSKAEEMRTSKLNSLEKQMAKLNAMIFEVK